jgi:putative PIG3 family NAD(P)H quinone oxidoreductase
VWLQKNVSYPPVPRGTCKFGAMEVVLAESYKSSVVSDTLLWQLTSPPREPEGNEILIRVEAAGVNRADLMQRAGQYPPPPGASDILGLEVSGVVTAIGPEVTTLTVGERVMALLDGGGYATDVLVDAGLVLKMPADYDFTMGAATMETLATVVLNLVIEAAAKPGETVMIHAGCSGVGTMAIKVAKLLGLRIFVSVGNQEKLKFAQELGALGGVVRHDEDFADHAKAWTAGRGFDIILDPVGGGYLSSNQRALATDGRLVVIGIMGGRYAQIDFGRMLVKRQRLIGSTLRSRSLIFKQSLIQLIVQTCGEALYANQIVPIVDRVLPVTAAEEAHALLSSNTTVGKVVLSIASS